MLGVINSIVKITNDPKLNRFKANLDKTIDAPIKKWYAQANQASLMNRKKI